MGFHLVQGIESEEVGPTSTSIRAINLKPQTEYAVRVTAYSYSPSVVKAAASEIAKFGTSIFTEGSGDMKSTKILTTRRQITKISRQMLLR